MQPSLLLGVRLVAAVPRNILQAILGCGISLTLALILARIQDHRLLLFACAGFLVLCCTLFLKFYKDEFWKGSDIPKILLSLTIFSSFIGPSIISVKVSSFSLFPYRILIVALAGIYMIQVLKTRRMISFQNLQVKPILGFFFFWMMYGIFAVSWSISPMDSIKELVYLITGILIIFYVLHLYSEENNYREFFVIWILMGLFLMGIGLINNLLQIHLPISRIYSAPIYQKTIPTSVFVNENDFASFLAISFFFYVSLIKNGKKYIYSIIGIVGVLLSLYLILVTSSRANYIAIAMGAVFWFLFVLKGRERRILTYLGIPAVLAVVFLFYNQLKSLFGMIATQVLSLLPGGGDEGASVNIRQNLLKNAKVFIENTFGFGISPGTVERYMKEYSVFNTHNDFNIHNWWAEIFVHYGFIVFGGYVLIFAYLIYCLIKINRALQKEKQSMISEALLCSLVVFIFASISPNSFMALNYNWLLVAFAIGYVNIYYHYVKNNGRKQC